jgi:hypothetical protein
VIFSSEICSTFITMSSQTLLSDHVCIYRSAVANFISFFNQLDLTLKYLYNSKTEFIICGDLNVEFSEDSSSKLLLSCFLQLHNLFRAVDFPTRFNNNSCCTAVCKLIGASTYLGKNQVLLVADSQNRIVYLRFL